VILAAPERPTADGSMSAQGSGNQPIGYAPFHPRFGWRVDLAAKDEQIATAVLMRSIDGAAQAGWSILPIYAPSSIADETVDKTDAASVGLAELDRILAYLGIQDGDIDPVEKIADLIGSQSPAESASEEEIGGALYEAEYGFDDLTPFREAQESERKEYTRLARGLLKHFDVRRK